MAVLIKDFLLSCIKINYPSVCDFDNLTIFFGFRLFDHIHTSGGVAKLRIIITNNTKVNVKTIYIKVKYL